MKSNEQKNKDYLNKLFSGENNSNDVKTERVIQTVNTTEHYDIPNIEYSNINLDILPAGRFYKRGTKISIRAAKVYEIQDYSMVNDNNNVDITEKMNELLSRNILFVNPDGTKGSYKDIKDSDRVYLIFMIRELTFQGGNTLTKETTCPSCNKDFVIPFRSTPTNELPITFELYEPNPNIEKYFDKERQVYELIYNDVSWELAPPTIGIQEDFYAEIKRNVEVGKKPNISFMKIMPYLLHDMNSISEEEIKNKLKDYINMDDLILFQGLNEIIDNMTTGIKGLKMKCPECGMEVHTEMTFSSGASSLFKIPNILDRFGK